ncbi:MAG TPA: hypothetical protein VFS64_10370 [Solirubrobacterales bacterium]|nr:hypothetical protein [Solirubrobacterales bacterium]
MKRFRYVSIAALLGAAVASGAVFLSLGVTSSYILIGGIGFLLILGGVLSDLRKGARQDPHAVQVHQAAIPAEHHYRAESPIRIEGLPVVQHTWDSDQPFRCTPLPNTARRARFDRAALVKKRHEFIRVRYGH